MNAEFVFYEKVGGLEKGPMRLDGYEAAQKFLKEFTEDFQRENQCLPMINVDFRLERTMSLEDILASNDQGPVDLKAYNLLYQCREAMMMDPDADNNDIPRRARIMAEALKDAYRTVRETKERQFGAKTALYRIEGILEHALNVMQVGQQPPPRGQS